MTKVTVAALQLAFSEDVDDNVAMVSDHVVKAAARGAKIILPPELFEGPYFCKVEDEALFATAKPLSEHPAVAEMRKVAKAERVYIPTSFFERHDRPPDGRDVRRRFRKGGGATRRPIMLSQPQLIR